MSVQDLSREHLESEFAPILNLSAALQVKQPAIEYFLGLTGSDDGKMFIGNSTKFIKGIIELTNDPDDVVTEVAYKTLINLATKDTICSRILSSENFSDVVVKKFEKILQSKYKHADLVCKFLSNLSRPEECARKVADIIKENEDKLKINKFVNALCKTDYNAEADLHYLAPIIANLSQIRHIRDEILSRDQWMIQRLLPFVNYKESDIRRLGIVSCIKNCCFDEEHHEWLLSDKVDMLSFLLLPLAGPEEFDDNDMEKLPERLQYLPPDKTREPNPEIRCILLQAILKLCATRQGRLFVKEKNTYIIIRELHKWERQRSNIIPIMNLIDILIGDEPEEGMENLHKVEIPEHLKEKFIKEDQEDEKEYMH
ncbi:protein HGH1 homolog [Saccostrea echinata]|uniref:protein HGH1 homolog n=1 Tax=Saccostrea echinata TaxID=191078 RepID=UPI002A83F124|nr:protein HGH1 homolog [Saccostrea echinata]XP_061198067.1 protein HGH1 homolog [Saccostrea echinata]